MSERSSLFKTRQNGIELNNSEFFEESVWPKVSACSHFQWLVSSADHFLAFKLYVKHLIYIYICILYRIYNIWDVYICLFIYIYNFRHFYFCRIRYLKSVSTFSSMKEYFSQFYLLHTKKLIRGLRNMMTHQIYLHSFSNSLQSII